MIRKKVPKAFSGLKFVEVEHPKFKSAKEEAAWWDSHEEVIADAFERAEKEGKITLSTIPPKLLPTKATTLRIPESDLERARQQAQSRGLRYQTYLKMLIHEGIERATRTS